MCAHGGRNEKKKKCNKKTKSVVVNSGKIKTLNFIMSIKLRMWTGNAFASREKQMSETMESEVPMWIIKMCFACNFVFSSYSSTPCSSCSCYCCYCYSSANSSTTDGGSLVAVVSLRIVCFILLCHANASFPIFPSINVCCFVFGQCTHNVYRSIKYCRFYSLQLKKMKMKIEKKQMQCNFA